MKYLSKSTDTDRYYSSKSIKYFLSILTWVKVQKHLIFNVNEY